MGYESMYAGFWSNLFLMEKGSLPNTNDKNEGT